MFRESSFVSTNVSPDPTVKARRDRLAENLLTIMAQRAPIEEDLEAVARKALAAAGIIYPPQKED